MRVFLCAVVLAVLVGCASFGNDFTLEDADKIKNGMTKDEVVATMSGQKPYMLTENSFTYLYTRANGMTGSNSSRRFTVHFDASGKVIDVPKLGYFGEISKHLDARPW